MAKKVSARIIRHPLSIFQTNVANTDGVTVVGSGLRRIQNNGPASNGTASVRTCQKSSTERIKQQPQPQPQQQHQQQLQQQPQKRKSERRRLLQQDHVTTL
jgi:hypothetical protein